ncbi:MAG: tyrosine-type recombinase/integrase [Verrucomicrobia bacterium]|nr:tyrosine-type recombinase/integrase [Verrucomicrobiota bacterium]
MTTKTGFWQEYVKRVGDTAALDTPQRYARTMHQAKDRLVQAIESFQQELSKIPIGAEIEAWLQNLDLPKEMIVEYEMYMLRLVDLGLLRLVNPSGELRMLSELTPNEHQAIIEEIRCSPKLTTSEKEKMVETYILFSQQLSRDTCRLIIQGEDPDFQRTIKKVVNYKEFIKFIQELQERDALMAKLLYFGAPTMDEVLNLRVNQVDVKKGMVRFNKFSVRYPKHVMLELKGYLAKKDKAELIFVNLRGEMVERTHLNNCFNRASRKISSTKRITPKMLLESDVANSVAANWPFASLSIQ